MKDKQISLTGIKPSGTPHIGNYLGMIKPALELAKSYRAFYFIADYHALTTVRDAAELRRMSYELTATFLALGMDPDEVVFFRQSDIPEIFELNWALSCFTAKGLLNRAHAYKAAVDENVARGEDPDAGVNAGLYNYPVLMAADILLYGSHIVPVGRDQKQHVEMTRDIAQAMNHAYSKEILVLPEAVIRDEVATIPGIDGRKMSKSYDNVIPIFAPPKDLRGRVMSVVTDSRPMEAPKDPDQDNVYNLFKYFASPDQDRAMRAKYAAGGFGYGEVKGELYELLEATFGEARERYDAYMADPAQLETVLMEGARKARIQGANVMKRVRKAVGVRTERKLLLEEIDG
ncbi:MAG TPA: tryptophan--tRNA ligase [Anaerolineales bacterium]|nr:tryptophan--tRNA ligase [Anaerolineales bacterium]